MWFTAFIGELRGAVRLSKKIKNKKIHSNYKKKQNTQTNKQKKNRKGKLKSNKYLKQLTYLFRVSEGFMKVDLRLFIQF